MRVICLTNFKGGTGKTTVAHNLAVGLTLAHKRVLAIDLDMQANLTIGMGVKLPDIRPENTSYSLLLANHPDISRYLIPIRHNLDLIPCILDAELETRLESSINRESWLAAKLPLFEDSYDYVICDTPPALHAPTNNGLVAATDVIIVVDSGWYAMMGVAQLMARVAAIKDTFRKNNQVIRGLINLYSKTHSVDNSVKEQVLEFFGPELMFRTMIPRNTELVKAAAAQQSIFEYNNGASAAFAFKQLVKEITYGQEEEAADQVWAPGRG